MRRLLVAGITAAVLLSGTGCGPSTSTGTAVDTGPSTSAGPGTGTASSAGSTKAASLRMSGTLVSACTLLTEKIAQDIAGGPVTLKGGYDYNTPPGPVPAHQTRTSCAYVTKNSPEIYVQLTIDSGDETSGEHLTVNDLHSRFIDRQPVPGYGEAATWLSGILAVFVNGVILELLVGPDSTDRRLEDARRLADIIVPMAA